MPGRTPNQIARNSAGLTTLVLVLVISGFQLVQGNYTNLLWLLLFAPISYFVVYRVMFFTMDRFIYNEIRSIYKTIHSNRGQHPAEPKVNMKKDVFGEVKEEVAVWAEEKIREVKELQASENFRKEFIGNLAHELKTPIFNIQGYIETLLDSDLSDADLNRKFLEKAAKSTDRITNLIKDLDDISNIDTGSIPLEMTEFDVVDLCRNVIDSLDQNARDAMIALIVKNPNDKPIPVIADKRRIEQVFTNLIVNSINYGKSGGETRIRFYDLVDNVLIEVADNGQGIAPQSLPRIFERFYRVNKSRSRSDGGSGLGLAICKHIIEAHKQTITVRSTLDVGTTFGFTLSKA